MKRDMELIRKIAIAIESADDLVHTSSIAIDGYDSRQIGYHCELMRDSQLINVIADEQYNEPFRRMIIDRLTSKGHDFVDASRNETVWKKAMTKATQTVGGVTIDVLIAYLKYQTREAFGLPKDAME